MLSIVFPAHPNQLSSEKTPRTTGCNDWHSTVCRGQEYCSCDIASFQMSALECRQYPGHQKSVFHV